MPSLSKYDELRKVFWFAGGLLGMEMHLVWGDHRSGDSGESKGIKAAVTIPSDK
jgi:hypothetical protein